MATVDTTVTILEHSPISAPLGTVSEMSLPLTFLDILWLNTPPAHLLCFYEFPCSKTHFMETLVPNLKHSLSITLQHFFPFAGNLVVFPYTNSISSTKRPEIRYEEGDSVSTMFTEYTKDNFNYLVGNHARKADEFYPLIPRLGEGTKVSDMRKFPLSAVQVTIFPNRGICIGLTNQHVLCDGSGCLNFLKAWASITKFGTGKPFLVSGSLPFYDRSVLKDRNSLGECFWDLVGGATLNEEYRIQHISGPTKNVRATFVMDRAQIQRLKESILARRATLTQVSPFTIVCSYIWSCLAKSRYAIEVGKDDDDELDQFIFFSGVRARMDPPIPATYFGNGITARISNTKSIHLRGKQGFETAIELIGEAIPKGVNNEENLFKGADTGFKEFVMRPGHKLGVAGSPKLNFYDTDFGWGKPYKCEFVSIDYTRSMSLSLCKGSEEGGLEIGLCLPKLEMDAFAVIFAEGLNGMV